MLQPTNIEFNSWVKNLKITVDNTGNISLAGTNTEIIGENTRKYLQQCADGTIPKINLIKNPNLPQNLESDVVLIPTAPKHMGKATEKEITCILDCTSELSKGKKGSNIGQKIEEARTCEIAKDTVAGIESSYHDDFIQTNEKELNDEENKRSTMTIPVQIPDANKESKQRIITFEMQEDYKFAIKQNFYMADTIVSIAKKYKGQYFAETKEWILKMKNYKEAAEEIMKYSKSKNVKVNVIPQFVFDLLQHKVPFSDVSKTSLINYEYILDDQVKINVDGLSQKIKESLYDFQRIGVNFGINHYGRILLGDEMGVGKTIQSLAMAYLYRKDWPLLILCPSSLKWTWKDEILKWLDHLSEDDIQVFMKGMDKFNPNVLIYIMSYNLATKLSKSIDGRKFGVVIADEAHYLKSRDSKRSMELVPVIMKAKRILLLTGTPILARPNELYNLVRILRPDIFHSFPKFGNRYCSPKNGFFGTDWSGNANTKELHFLINNRLMIRRLKKEVLTELPSKRRQRIIISTDQKITKKITKLLNKVKNWDENIEEKNAEEKRREKEISKKINNYEFDKLCEELNTMDNPVLNALDDRYRYIVNAYRLTGDAKIKGILQFVETLVENNLKFIIFAHHLEILNSIEEEIIKREVSYIRIDGSIDPHKRHLAVKKFQEDQDCKVAILSITASSTGITLTAASTVVFAEMNWTPGVMIQAEDRAHRIGQTNSVNVYYLYGECTLDHLIYPRLKLKSEVIANCLDGEENNFEIENIDKDDENEEQRKIEREKREERKRIKKEESLRKQMQKVDRVVGDSEDLSFQQTNISDFFFLKERKHEKFNQLKQIPLPNLSLNQEEESNKEIEIIHVDDLSKCVEINCENEESNREIIEQVDSESTSNKSFEFLPEPILKCIPDDAYIEDEVEDIYEDDWFEGTNQKGWRDYQQLRRKKNKILREEEWEKQNDMKRVQKKYWKYKKMVNNGRWFASKKSQLPAPRNPDDNSNMNHLAKIEQEAAEEEALKENYRRLQQDIAADMCGMSQVEFSGGSKNHFSLTKSSNKDPSNFLSNPEVTDQYHNQVKNNFKENYTNSFKHKRNPGFRNSNLTDINDLVVEVDNVEAGSPSNTNFKVRRGYYKRKYY